MLREAVADADVVITTALIPNRPAPILVKQSMIDGMKRGSVIVDLVAENGGNAECTVKDKVVVTPNGVKCVGYTDLPGRMATVSSELFSGNVTKLLVSMEGLWMGMIF